MRGVMLGDANPGLDFFEGSSGDERVVGEGEKGVGEGSDVGWMNDDNDDDVDADVHADENWTRDFSQVSGLGIGLGLAGSTALPRGRKLRRSSPPMPLDSSDTHPTNHHPKDRNSRDVDVSNSLPLVHLDPDLHLVPSHDSGTALSVDHGKGKARVKGERRGVVRKDTGATDISFQDFLKLEDDSSEMGRERDRGREEDIALGKERSGWEGGGGGGRGGDHSDPRAGPAKPKRHQKARSISVRRLGKAEKPVVVHNQGGHGAGGGGSTSISTGSGHERERARNRNQSPHHHHQPSQQTLEEQSHTRQTPCFSSPSTSSLPILSSPSPRTGRTNRHRRNTSESLNTALRAHAITMAAIESMSPSASLSILPRGRSRTLDSLPMGPTSSSLGQLNQMSPSLTRKRRISIAAIATARDGVGEREGFSARGGRGRGRGYDGGADDDEWEEEDEGDEEEGEEEEQDHASQDTFHFQRTPYPFTPPPPPPRHSLPAHFPSPTQSQSHPPPSSQANQSKPRTHQSQPQTLQRQPRSLKGKQIVGLAPSASDHWSVKGKQVLGLATRVGDVEFDLRTKYARDALLRGGKVWSGEVRDGGAKIGGGGGGGERECVVWLSLESRNGRNGRRAGGEVGRVERVVVPGNLTTTTVKTSPGRKRDMGYGEKEGNAPGHQKEAVDAKRADTAAVDFDDEFLAERLRDAYCKLAGSWFKRTFSARSLRCIQLGEVGVWSGVSSTPSSQSPASSSAMGLLGAGDGFEMDDERSPFTEHRLLELFRNPQMGKARYAWVHWARRISCSNMRSRSGIGAGDSVRRERAEKRSWGAYEKGTLTPMVDMERGSSLIVL